MIVAQTLHQPLLHVRALQPSSNTHELVRILIVIIQFNLIILRIPGEPVPMIQDREIPALPTANALHQGSMIVRASNCWAGDIVHRHGRFWWYFSRGSLETGVAVADHPEGPWNDALGGPLVDSFHPSIFVDEDDTP